MLEHIRQLAVWCVTWHIDRQMAKQGVTQVAVNKQQAIEGFLVIASTARELHGSIAEQLAAHLVTEGQITGYTIYTISIDVTIG
jgi:hypothetical protein